LITPSSNLPFKLSLTLFLRKTSTSVTNPLIYEIVFQTAIAKKNVRKIYYKVLLIHFCGPFFACPVYFFPHDSFSSHPLSFPSLPNVLFLVASLKTPLGNAKFHFPPSPFPEDWPNANRTNTNLIRPNRFSTFLEQRRFCED
jgi:hypothetical protein